MPSTPEMSRANPASFLFLLDQLGSMEQKLAGQASGIRGYAPEENRQRRKELGLCKDCPNRAIDGQSRCSSCSEKSRQRHVRRKEVRSSTRNQQ